MPPLGDPLIRQFERLFERQGVAFFGKVTLGVDLTLDDLADSHDAVVLATGIAADRRLGIPGKALPGAHGSGQVTRARNGCPDTPPVALGECVVVIGNGNVALDLVRLLAKTPAEIEGSEIDRASGRVRRIDVVGRSAAKAAKFDPVMLREIGRLATARIRVEDGAGEGPVPEALAAIDGHAPEGATTEIVFRSGWQPRSFDGDSRDAREHQI